MIAFLLLLLALSSGPDVRIKDHAFLPSTLTVSVGTTVTWTNEDETPHQVAQTGGGFKSAALDTDDRYTYKFNKPGTYDYFCPLHPQMRGTIIVK